MAEGGERRDPSSHRTPRQIRRQVDGYNARPEQVRKRVKNNQARAAMEKQGRVHKGDGKDVHHKTPLRHGGGNSPGNLGVLSKSRNRGWRSGRDK
jgi:hypothetical protein